MKRHHVLRSQLSIFDQLEASKVFATSPAGPVPIQLDAYDLDRLRGRRVSLGSHGYAQVWDEGKHELLHRWILGCKVRDGRLVDHMNGDVFDCRRSNLRLVTYAESTANRRPRAASGFIGIEQLSPRSWRARGYRDGHAIHLGTFPDALTAARVSHAWRLKNLPGYTGRGSAVTAQRQLHVAA